MAYYKENDFEQWLQNDPKRWNDAASVSSYKSGMRSFISWIDDKENKVLWNSAGNTKFRSFQFYISRIDKEKVLSTFFSALDNIIKKSIEQSSYKSVLQNYKSYLSAYEQFCKWYYTYNKYPSNAGLPDSQLKFLRKNSSSVTYSHDELIDEFSGRILLQDRISTIKNVLFPIRLINNLWQDKASQWAKQVSENIYLIVKDEKNVIKEIQIKDIISLEILKSGSVKVSVKNHIDSDTNDSDSNSILVYTLLTSYSEFICCG